ncbi:hypothetical protein KPSA3_03897 [Pseudomonas syringae pv. actinidiae]|uniref:Uncharacterized protein n=1 Tax=Pseudomonas syringae pv. actinidiae TaxID=103796 RepID=A0AAN4Q6Q8_PSESF|nr:hypothetical protein KPSA3_03897 [Pseudomonas syringae pv. actinidiae]
MLEKATTPFAFKASRILKNGSPILIPSALASGVRAITQPSLLLSTTTGTCRSSGRNSRSHEQ